MEQPIKKILSDKYREQITTKEVLANLSDIELTEEEQDVAIIQAKQKKKAILEYQEREKIITKNREALTTTQWDFKQTAGYMMYRAVSLFGKDGAGDPNFRLDASNQVVFDLLCLYFSNDREFISTAANLGIKNPSLDKGILLSGVFGTGKTWIMQLFGKNKRQVFSVVNSKKITGDFMMKDGEKSLLQYYDLPQNPINDANVFYHKHTGLCIDDMGAEDVKNNFGNKTVVIAEIIERRYANHNTGLLLHGTTNLTLLQLNDLYGPRVLSRMKEIFNVIILPGADRRK